MFLPTPILQRWIYNSLGYAIHKTSRIYPQCFCGAGKGKLKVGSNSYINYRVFLDLGNDIVIGNNVSIAFNCTFIEIFSFSGIATCSFVFAKQKK